MWDHGLPVRYSNLWGLLPPEHNRSERVRNIVHRSAMSHNPPNLSKERRC